MSRFDLGVESHVALITGGASGIGLSVAEVFGEAGYRIVIADIDGSACEKTASDLNSRGIATEFLITDVADEQQVALAVEAGPKRWNRLDFVFNNAGIVGHGAPIEKLDAEDLDRVLAVNLKSVFYVCKYAVPAMRARGGGSILNVSSITAQTGSSYYPAYSASKAGVVALTRGLARSVGRFNIRINCLNPGSISGTNLMHEYYASAPGARRLETLSLLSKIPLGRQGQPRDIAHLALFLASPLATHLHGAVLTIDGGERLGYQ